jgi:hypothetical protein
MGAGHFVMMKEVAAPITVGGRHWGGLRLAFKFWWIRQRPIEGRSQAKRASSVATFSGFSEFFPGDVAPNLGSAKPWRSRTAQPGAPRRLKCLSWSRSGRLQLRPTGC